MLHQPDISRVNDMLLFLVLTVAIHSYMFLVNLPQLLTMSSGMLLFDLVPAGYDQAYAEAFLTALGEEGRWFYLSRQWAWIWSILQSTDWAVLFCYGGS